MTWIKVLFEHFGLAVQKLSLANVIKLVKAVFTEDPRMIASNMKNYLLGQQDHNVPVTPKKLVVLYVSPNLPDYDTSSGGRRATRMIEILCQFFDVYLFTKGERPNRHVHFLESFGATIVDGNEEELARLSIPYVDFIIYAWYYSFFDCHRLLEFFPNAKIIIDTVDVHWVRELRSIGIHPDFTEKIVQENKQREIQALENADVIWAVSAPDQSAIFKELPKSDVSIVSNIHEIERAFQPKSNKSILFIGGYRHYPNIRAAEILCSDILPKIRQVHPEVSLTLAGSNAPPEVSKLSEIEGVEYIGFVEEVDLPDLYDKSKVVIVPLESGAGIKGKICEAIAYGVPVITNKIGNEGIDLKNKQEGFVTDDYGEMADYAIKIFDDNYDLDIIVARAQQKILQLVGPDHVGNNMLNSMIPTISICIVTYNKLELLKNCIASILGNTTYPKYVIKIHSNGCTDGTVEYLKELMRNHDHIDAYLADTNDVFVFPNNQMMKIAFAEGHDVVLLNNDTEVTSFWLTNLVRTGLQEKSCGIVGSKILYPDGRLQEFGSELYPDRTGLNKGKNKDPQLFDFQHVLKAPYVSGCSMYIKHSTIKQIGVFDEQFHPCYCEDSDYCYSAWKVGIETFVTPYSEVFHHEGSTSGTSTESGFKKYQKINFEKFLNKHAADLDQINGQINNWNKNKLEQIKTAENTKPPESQIQAESQPDLWMPPGHRYSPIPAKKEVWKNRDNIYQELTANEIDYHHDDQLKLLTSFFNYYNEFPYMSTKSNGLRFRLDSGNFGHADALSLYSMLRKIQPKNIYVIGFSDSLNLILDLKDMDLIGSKIMLFVPEDEDDLTSYPSVDIVYKDLYDIPTDHFQELEKDDVLFIDSSHVSKVGSDVNRILFHILPKLRAGVVIHFHDIFGDFELPYDWAMEGRAWNECYILRAFLMHNLHYRILLFNNYIVNSERNWFEQNCPLYLENPGGSIWLLKSQ